MDIVQYLFGLGLAPAAFDVDKVRARVDLGAAADFLESLQEGENKWKEREREMQDITRETEEVE